MSIVASLLFALLADPVVLNDDGGWCWFQDPRALVVDGRLVFGSVASGAHDPARRGHVEVTVHDLASGATTRSVLHERLQLDDHDAPAFGSRRDGRLLALYAMHGNDDRLRWRISEHPADATSWGPEHTVAAGGAEHAGVTYANAFALDAPDGSERLVCFYRGAGWDPNLVASDDGGATWRHEGRLLAGPGRPYLKYASNGRDTVHFIATEQHPRDFDNGLHHGFVRHGAIFASDGTRLGAVGAAAVPPGRLTQVYAGGPDRVAWAADLELDAHGHPVAAFSVQRGGAGVPRGSGGEDHRYHYARWDGERWREHEMAFAGSRLYAGEDDYTGLVAIDPDDLDQVFISCDVDPATGTPLRSGADGGRHHEIFRGRTADRGVSWSWTAVTRDSTADNIRPVVPARGTGPTALLWLRGVYRSYTDYDLDVVGLVLDAVAPRPAGSSLVYAESFDTAASLAGVRVTDPGAWRFGEDAAGGGFLELFRDSTYAPPHRSPLSIAVLPTPVLASFVLEARVSQIGRDYAHRDLCVFFGIRDAAHYYYAHLASSADATAHHVHIVDGAARTPVTTSRTTGVDWGRDAWHRVRVERDVGAGTVRVLFDGVEVLGASDATFDSGFVGFGSFDDTGRIDDVRIWSAPDAPDATDAPRPALFEPLVP